MQLQRNLLERFRGPGLAARTLRGVLGSGGLALLNRLFMLALSIILAQMLGAEGLGTYAHAIAIMALIAVIAEGGVPTLLMRELAAANERGDWGLARGALRRAGPVVALAASSVSLAGLLLLWQVHDRLSEPVLYTMGAMLLALPLVVAGKTVAFAIRGFDHVLIGHGLETAFRRLLVVILVLVAFTPAPDLRAPQIAIICELIAALIVLAGGIVLLRHLVPRRLAMSTPQYRDAEWSKSMFPFMLISGAGVINTQVDIALLGFLRPADEVGVYQVAAHGAMVVGFGLRVVNPVLGPRIARLYASGDHRRLEKLVTYATRAAFLAALPLVLLFLLFGADILGWVFGAGFAHGYPVLVILALAYLVNVTVGPMGVLLNMSEHESINGKILSAAVIVNVCLNLLLIPVMGILGAAIATAISLVMRNALQAWMAYRLLGVSAFRLRNPRTTAPGPSNE